MLPRVVRVSSGGKELPSSHRSDSSLSHLQTLLHHGQTRNIATTSHQQQHSRSFLSQSPLNCIITHSVYHLHPLYTLPSTYYKSYTSQTAPATSSSTSSVEPSSTADSSPTTPDNNNNNNSSNVKKKVSYDFYDPIVPKKTTMSREVMNWYRKIYLSLYYMDIYMDIVLTGY